MHIPVDFIIVVILSIIKLGYQDNIQSEWDEWKEQYGKTYDNLIEEKFRMQIFVQNKRDITKHNELSSQGYKQYFLKINQFGDLTTHEFRSLMNLYEVCQVKSLDTMPTKTFPSYAYLPQSVDWRTYGAVADVKNESNLGFSWAFSVTGSLEGQYFRKTGKLVVFSEQNLIDCVSKNVSNGCKSRSTITAFEYLSSNGFINTEDFYLYKKIGETCQNHSTCSSITISDYMGIETGDEMALKKAVATIGPISVTVNAFHRSFQFYSHGVYDEPECYDYVNLAMLVVGYGIENNQEYWLIKNSWSAYWGEEGYIRITRNNNNHCGIASKAFFPII